MIHGTAGTFDIDITASVNNPAAAVFEMRHAVIGGSDNGPGPRDVVVRFDRPVDITGAVVTLSSGGYTALTPTMPDTMEINGISGVADNTCLNINMQNIAIASSNPPPPNCILANADLYIKVCTGEVSQPPNAGNPITIFDLSYIKSQLFKPVAAGNFDADIKADGFVNIFDIGLCKSNLFKQPAGEVTCP
jgi:hypothetical protein